LGKTFVKTGGITKKKGTPGGAKQPGNLIAKGGGGVFVRGRGLFWGQIGGGPEGGRT